MGNATDYLLWRGDLTFSERPFCLPDNLVLAILSYIDFSGAVPTPEEAGGVTIREAWKKISTHGTYRVCCSTDIDRSFLQAAAESERFGSAVLSNYRDVLDPETEIQFAAITVQLDDGTCYLSFRGTDQSLLGWKEDFTMGFQKVPAQAAAICYIEDAMRDKPGTLFRVGGHSKGGNLAVYGAMNCLDEHKERILAIYDNDGPGLSAELLQTEKYETIREKVVRLLPEFCVVGMLFEHESRTAIVKSSAQGLLQHHSITWQIEGNDFVYGEGIDPNAKMVNDMFRDWIEGVDMESRRAFVEDFFGTAGAGGATSLADFAGRGVGGFEAVLLAMLRSRKISKTVFGKLIRSGYEQIRQRFHPVQLLRRSGVVRGTIVALIGILFMTLPIHAIQILAYGVMFAILIFSACRIVHYAGRAWRTSPDAKIHMASYGALFLLTAVLSCFGVFVAFSSNLCLGLVLVIFGVLCLKRAASIQNQQSRHWWILWAQSILSFTLGIVVWVAWQHDLHLLIFVIGTFLAIRGIYKIVSSVSIAAKQSAEMQG